MCLLPLILLRCQLSAPCGPWTSLQQLRRAAGDTTPQWQRRQTQGKTPREDPWPSCFSSLPGYQAVTGVVREKRCTHGMQISGTAQYGASPKPTPRGHPPPLALPCQLHSCRYLPRLNIALCHDSPVVQVFAFLSTAKCTINTWSLGPIEQSTPPLPPQPLLSPQQLLLLLAYRYEGILNPVPDAISNAPTRPAYTCTSRAGARPVPSPQSSTLTECAIDHPIAH